MPGWYEIAKNEKGEYSFVLKAANAQVVLRSEQYTTKASAQTGIESVRTNSPADERYERKTSTDGRPYFNLKAVNHQIIGTSQMYSSDEARDKGIESVKTNGPTDDVREV